MTISIQYQGGGTTYFQTVVPSDNTDKKTGSFFDASSFGNVERPNWITNYSSQREGGFKHYVNKRDSNQPVLLHLTGTSRFSDLEIWKKLSSGTVFYLVSDTDSNLDGNYVITQFGKPKYLESSERIELPMIWEAYNN